MAEEKIIFEPFRAVSIAVLFSTPSADTLPRNITSFALLIFFLLVPDFCGPSGREIRARKTQISPICDLAIVGCR
jgi:hypothetical protein